MYYGMVNEVFYIFIGGCKCMFIEVLYKVNDYIVITRDNPYETPWKAKIKQFIYHWWNESVIVHLADYYRHCTSIVQDCRGYKLVNDIDEVKSMNLIYITRLIQFNKDSIKPLNRLQHKFMAISSKDNKAVAYESAQVESVTHALWSCSRIHLEQRLWELNRDNRNDRLKLKCFDQF